MTDLGFNSGSTPTVGRDIVGGCTTLQSRFYEFAMDTLRADQISQVRGFADQRLLTPEDPKNPSNRRISIIVRNHGIDLHEEVILKSAAASGAEEPGPVQRTE